MGIFRRGCNILCVNPLQAFVPFIVAIAVFLVVLYVYLPETKGRTVEDIAAEMAADGAWAGKFNRNTRGPSAAAEGVANKAFG